MFDRFTDDARRAVVVAQEEARYDGSAEIAPRHVALGGLAQGAVVALLGDRAVALVEKLRRPAAGVQREGRIPFTNSTKFALEQSLRLSMQFDHVGITSAHVLLGAATCGDPDVEAALRLAEIDIASLLDGVRALPSTPPDELTVAQLRRYLSVPGSDAGVHRRFEVQLVDALLREGDLAEARLNALQFLAAGNTDVAPALIVIGELTGDMGLIIGHAAAALEAADSSPSHRASYAVALAHAGRFEEGRREITAARAEAAGIVRDGVTIEAAELELLSGDPDVAAALLDEVDEPDPGQLPLLRMLWMRVRVDVAWAQGDPVDVGPPAIEAPSINARYYRMSLELALLHAAIGRGKPSATARIAGKLAADADRFGLRSVAAEARAVRGEALRLAGKRKWRRELEHAASEFEALGRVVVAERLRATLAAP